VRAGKSTLGEGGGAYPPPVASGLDAARFEVRQNARHLAGRGALTTDDLRVTGRRWLAARSRPAGRGEQECDDYERCPRHCSISSELVHGRAVNVAADTTGLSDFRASQGVRRQVQSDARGPLGSAALLCGSVSRARPNALAVVHYRVHPGSGDTFISFEQVLWKVQ
jgi:hypothetical protein